MSALPSRTLTSTRQDHLDDHMEIRRLHNILDAGGYLPSPVDAPVIGQVLTVVDNSPLELEWADLPSGSPYTTGLEAQAGLWLNTAAHAHTINGVKAILPIELPAADDELNAIVVKIPDYTWGIGQDYGEGNILVVMSDALNTVPSPTPALKAITGVTNASPPVLTCVAHGWLTGDNVRITGIPSLANINNLFWQITKITNDTFSLCYAQGVPAPAPGGTASSGWAYSDRNSLIQRTADSGLGVQSIHVAHGTRGRVGQVVGGAGAIGIDVDPSEDIIGIIFRNPTTSEWNPTTVGAFWAAQDTRGAGGYRTVAEVQADGTLSLRPQEGKASTALLLKLRNDADSADVFYAKVDGGIRATGVSSIGLSVPISNINLVVQATLDANVAGGFYAASAGQTGDLLQLSSHTGTLWSKFNKAGYFMTRKTAAPADGDLGNSEVALWLDATPGAMKLMLKAKDSGGTVKTGSVNIVT